MFSQEVPEYSMDDRHILVPALTFVLAKCSSKSLVFVIPKSNSKFDLQGLG